MSEKTIYEEKWESKGFNGSIRLILPFNTNTHKEFDLAIKQSISPENIKYGDVVIFPSYRLLKEIIFYLASDEKHGKEEVERELGIKITGGDKNGV